MSNATTPEQELATRAHHALTILKKFPNGGLTRQETDALATAAYHVLRMELPNWRANT